MKTPLCQALDKVVAQRRLRCHVPFHAGTSPSGLFGEDLWRYDLTELPGLDVLNAPTETLKASQEAVAELFRAAHSFYLVNGATVGLHAALLAIGQADVALARNCHGAVVNALVLTGGIPHWVLPHYQEAWGLWGAVSPSAVEACLRENPKIAAVVITHPTYEGIVSDIAAIAQVCHAHGALLIVDEAHGATFALSDAMPPSAIASGADVVIHSMHKSGGALTQGALLHLPHGSRVTPERLQAALKVLQTTSPSYPLLASLESACAYLDSPHGRNTLAQRLTEAQQLRHWVNTTCQTLRAYDHGALGLQVYLCSNKVSGEDLGEALEETHNISFESVSPDGCLLNWNLGLPDGALGQVQAALLAIDTQSLHLPAYHPERLGFALPQQALSPREAFYAEAETIPTPEALGRIAVESVWKCPPGIPLVVPGEALCDVENPALPSTVRVATLPALS